MLKHKWFEIYNHTMGWLVFMSLPIVFMARHWSDASILLQSYPYWQFLICFFSTFYIGYYYLVPTFFLRNRYFYFSLSVTLLLVAICLLRPFDNLMRTNRKLSTGEIHWEAKRGPFPHPLGERVDGLRMPPPNGPRRIDITSVFLFILSIVLGMAIRVTAKWRTTERRMLQAQADRAKAELSFLKAQINPHFLFNTLNNIYTLSLMDHPNTSESIMKLSNIMRYVTDDVTQEWVPLRDEIACIGNYIDLQKLRLGKKSPVSFTVKGSTIDSKRIAPLILMTFIENTFKYGISKKDESPVVISIEAEDVIHFKCTNCLFENREKESTGIGIENTKQRLQHVYGNKFDLNISCTEGLFEVDLKLI